MKILHITPSYFAPESIMGGGERYVHELVRFMAEESEVCLLSFGARRETRMVGRARFEIYPVSRDQRESLNNPVAIEFLRELFWADVIQTHQVHTWVGDVSALIGKMLGKSCFTLDHGGGGGRVLSRVLPVFSCYRRAMAVSECAIGQLPKALQGKASLVRGGVDTDFFRPGSPGTRRPKRILYAGRVLPHKGVHVLLEAVRLLNDPEIVIHLVGREGDPSYGDVLREKSRGLNVVWKQGLNDEELRREYQEAHLSVLLSSYRSYFGNTVAAPENMGLVLVEAQACGTPVLCTRVGGMPEFVRHQETGWVVPSDNAPAVAEALREAFSLSENEREAYSMRARAYAETLDWRRLVQRYLEIYRQP